MKPKEAIKAIKCNYPPEHYALLREALDLAMDLMRKNRARWPKRSNV
jgi:hypothetical protein